MITPEDVDHSPVVVTDSSSESEELSHTPSRSLSEEIFGGGRRLTFHMLLNSCATHLNLLRFELRVLRFFNDICVPHITFGVNKKHVEIWQNVVPRYFRSSHMVRQAILANGALALLTVSNVNELLEADLYDQSALELIQKGVGDTNSRYAEPGPFDVGTRTNVFLQTANFYAESLEESNKALVAIKDSDFDCLRTSQLDTMVGLILSGSLIISYLCLHPHRVVPLVDFVVGYSDEPSTDILQLTVGMRELVINSLGALQSTDVGGLFQTDELTYPVRSQFNLINDLRKQMVDFYKHFEFYDFTEAVASDMSNFNLALDILEKSILVGIKFNFPLLLFRWMGLSPSGIFLRVRQRNYFALRLLFVYSSLCMYCRFLFTEENIWRDYVEWFHAHYQPMCEFDQRIYHYVAVREKRVQNYNYRTMKEFDVWSAEFDIQDD